jgi:AraC family transcriptional regulator of adaptative response/methylated-DNA-[protein]-cysteine methyltransferase
MVPVSGRTYHGSMIGVRSDDERWRAVLARRDGPFLYAVRSTGIYCRPACPSRRPRRGQVAFFGDADSAERAGFRACRRCRPRHEPRERELVRRACELLDADSLQAPRLNDLGRSLGVSPWHLQRLFKRALGITPRQYAEARRLARVKASLKKGDDVTTALYGAGYGSSSRLYESAPERLGMTPGAYKRGGRGLRIGYALVDSPLGRLLVAASARGLCSVKLGDSDARLVDELRGEYAEAELVPDANGLEPWLRPLLRHLEGREPRLDIPLDLTLTAFQWRVYEALRAIPYGETRSYADVARAIGQPRAVRAVARACATNPVALVVPCHRVVPRAGGAGGYRWGKQRKQELLARERGRRSA